MDNVDTLYNSLKEKLHKEPYKEKELKIIEQDFNKLYQDLILFLVHRKDRYYGYILMNFELNITFTQDIIAGVSILHKYPFVLTINPLLLLQFNLNEILFILCHEVEHLVLMHPDEIIKRNPTKDKNKTLLFNYAMDAAVNESLKQDIMNGSSFLHFPKNCIDASVISKISNNPNIKTDESFMYYYELIKNCKITKRINLGLIDSKVGGEFIFDFDTNTSSELIKNFIQNALNNMSEKGISQLPLHQKRNIEKLLNKNKINWKKVLKQYIGNIPDSYQKSKTKLNRRQPLRYDLCGKIKDYTLKIVVAIDTSGSMTNKELNNIMLEIFNIVNKKKYEITLIQFDADIKDVKKFKKPSNLVFNLIGGGGTTYEPVIDYINDNSYYKDAILIWFTDGYGDKEIKKPNVYKNLWVILNDEKNLSVKNPYGKVMTLNINE